MGISNPSRPKRKRSVSGPGKAPNPAREAHLISLSARDDAKPFCSLRDGEIVLNTRGEAIAACWKDLGALRPGLKPDALVISPRRVEGILLLPMGDAPTLSEAVRLFKVISSLRLSRPGKGASALWKKGYAEKSASGAEELAALRKAMKKPGLKAPADGRTYPGTK